MVETDYRPFAAESYDTRKSFDVMASVDMLRYDLKTVGYVHPETMQRVYDEELTYIAEGINRPITTEFVLKNIDGVPSYFDRGAWRPYIATLITGLHVAQKEADEDSRKTFLADRATEDLAIGYRLMELLPGEKLVWTSRFPNKERALYGDVFLSQLGFQTARRMGFLYQAEKLADGSVVLRSQSVDNSDETAFTAALQHAHEEPQTDLESITAAYDTSLADTRGEELYAGRKVGQRQSENNAWGTIQQHRDLIDYFFDHLVKLASDRNIPLHQLEQTKKQLTIGLWAALKQRLDHRTVFSQVHVQGGPWTLQQEITSAYNSARRGGEVLAGCGGSMKANDALMKTDPKDLFDSIFGNEGSTTKERWVWKSGVCRTENCPTRPGRTKVGPCSICQNCQYIFDKGKDPTKEYSSK